MLGKGIEKTCLSVTSRAAHAGEVIESVELADLMKSTGLLVKRVVCLRGAGDDGRDRLRPEVTDDLLAPSAVPG